MVQILQVEDPIVNVEDINKFKLAFLMQFFVQHKQRFRFPRIRLQDLYQHILIDTDAVPLCDCVARILRFLRHRDPMVCIASVDEALDAFVSEKRTTHRQALQAARAGRAVADLDAPARALLLEHLIECVYDERPELSFNAVLNAPKDNVVDKDVGIFGPPDDESLLIKAGQDATGSSYYYMDDLRLYRETPQSGLSSHWSVAVGPTIHQWTSFIASLGRVGEEADLCHFLQHELFAFVQECIENPYMNQLNDELNSARLLDKEAAELAEIRRQRGLPPITTVAPQCKSSLSPPPPPPQVAPLVAECSGGSSAGSSSGNSTSTCPLTPPNGTPSVLVGISQISQTTAPTPERAPDAKECPTAPDTPAVSVWFPESHSSSAVGVSAGTRYQHPSSVDPPRSSSALCSSSSPSQDCKTTVDTVTGQSQLDSPLRRPASGPTPSAVASQADGGQPHSAPPFSSFSTGAGRRRASMTISCQSSSAATGPKPEAGCNVVGGIKNEIGTISKAAVSSSAPAIVSSASHPSAAVGPSLMIGGPPGQAPSHTLVFTTELANEAAAKYARTRLRITTFHSMHPLVHQFMVHNGWSPGAAAVGGVVDHVAVTQEQLENRKSKMAQLEKIHSKLTKSKMASTPGAATVAAMQQQIYAGGGQISQLSPTGGAVLHPDQLPPQQPGVISPDIQYHSRGMMVPRPEERDFDRISWVQQRKHPGAMGDPSTVHFPYGGPAEHMVAHTPSAGGPPVLVVPPNNACGYPSSSNRFCVPSAPPPPPYKRPYPPEMTPPEQQFWDQQQAMFEQHQQQQQAMLLQQQVQPPIVTTASSVSCGRPNSGRSGLSKKRKSTTAAANRSTPTRPVQPTAASPFGGPQRLPQPPGGGIKSGGFGSVPIGPPRGSVSSNNYQPMPGDSMNGGYANSGFRSAVVSSGGGAHVMEQSAYAPTPSGSTGSSIPSSSSSQHQQQQQQTLSGNYNHSADSAPLSSSSTQHLTSASLASLARLSQLSGSEGPFCSPTTSTGPLTPSGYSRMTSVPDILGFSSNGGVMPNPESDPSSLYSMGTVASTPSAGGSSSFQGLPMSHSSGQGGQQLSSPPVGHTSGFHNSQSQLSPHQQLSQAQGPQLMGRPLDQIQPPNSGGVFPSADQVRPGDARCLTPTSAPPICPTSASPTIPTTTTPSSSAVSQQASQQPPSIQVNNTFFNAQLNVQQMNYQHVNGVGGSSQMQIHFMQQQQQRPFFGGNGGPPTQPPPPNQKVEARTSQQPTNVQITPKTPHTIQYLPSSTAAAATSTTNVLSCVQYPSQTATAGNSGKLRLSQSVSAAPSQPASRMQSPTHPHLVPSSVATAPAASTSNSTSSLAASDHRGAPPPAMQQQRGPKVDPTQSLPPPPLPMTAAAQGTLTMGSGGSLVPPEVSTLPDGLYGNSGVAASKYPQAFSISVLDPPLTQQP
uniref:LsmAD domain-containing protein n=2 Tax=Mesocestoides corti TaxID=53468 RepID=A0A5K3FK09_MESCO